MFVDMDGIWENLVGATFEIQNTALIQFGVAPAGTFSNSGLLRKTSAGTTDIRINLSNPGTVDVDTGTLLLSTTGAFSNFSGTTLTGGTYDIAGTFQFNGANIVTNAATIILDGPASAIQNSPSNVNALANLATIAATGGFQIKNARNFTLPGTLTNMGLFTIGPVIAPGDTTLAVGTYNQIGGTTALDGGHLSGGTMISSDTAVTGDGVVTTPLFVNTGTVTAEGPGGPPLGGGDSLDLSGVAAIVNDGLLRAISGGTMELTENVSGNGTYRADDGTLRLLPGGGAGATGLTLEVLNDGRVDVNDGADITLSGPATLESGGVYAADPQSVAEITNAFSAATATVHCTAQMLLEDSMVLMTGGDLTLDGESTPECSQEGGTTPPVFNIIANAMVQVGGNFQIAGCAQVSYSSTQLLALAGELDNQSTCASSFQWSGGVLMNGDTEAAQSFEVAGSDVGPTPAGFANNYAMGSVQVANGASATVRDEFDNDGLGQTPCGEALYVSQLVLEAGSTLVLDNCRVYVGQLMDQGATINLVGCGGLHPTGDANGDGMIDLIDYCNFGACLIGAMLCSPSVSCSAFDYDADGDSDLADFAVFQAAFGPNG